ncbi:MAG: sulfatase-like hydrolase/transferase [Verrucomicrobiota bacterium]
MNPSPPDCLFLRPVRVCLAAALTWLAGALPVWAAQPPNIILYLADDLGYGDLAFMGHPYAKTPHIDQLAKEGTAFLQHYVAGVTCAPSRAGLMTGVHPARYPHYPGHYGTGEQPTITQLLKDHGYATGHFGKWHMGPDESPGTYGYDEVFSESNNRNSFHTPSRDEPLTDRAIDFIERMAKSGQPFYANVWGHSTHYPVEAYPELIAEFGEIPFDRADFSELIQERFDRSQSWKPDLQDSMTQYVADVYGIDKNVGRIMETLERLGIAENTILVFSSDHGPQNENRERDFAEHMLGYAGPLRGYKGNQFEGGVRVPFIIRWPGKVPAGRIDEESVTSFLDWLPTLGRITGLPSLPENLDGEDLSRVWLSGPAERASDLYWRPSSPGAGVSIRAGDWKFHESKNGPLLYDLSKDISESQNVASAFPEITERLAKKADKWRAALPETYQKDKRFGKGRDAEIDGVEIPPPLF